MDLLDETLTAIGGPDEAAMAAARTRIGSLTMPPWALGRICDLAVQLAGITGLVPPPVERRAIVVMAGDHGVVAEGVSPHSAAVTGQMMHNIVSGGAGVNVFARLNRARVVPADFGMADRDEELVRSGALLDYRVAAGSASMARGSAMSRAQAIQAIENGILLARGLAADTDVFGTGEMGIGNTTPATAVAAVFTGRPVVELCGPGTGLGREGMEHKTRVIESAIARNKPDATDALDVLGKIGGFELGGIAGLVLGGAAIRKPVLVDGFISTAGAMLARALCPAVAPFIILAHASAEPGHQAMCDWLGCRPLLSLGMRLGEGTGSALALNLVDAACRMLTEMATFDSAGVDAKLD